MPGIHELLVNAIEHGNLGIGYEEKTRLNSSATWYQEVVGLQVCKENAHKKVQASCYCAGKEVILRIADEGAGFNWNDYLEISAVRAPHSHGRGIALARLVSFDSLEYLGCGNEVCCRVRLK